MQHTSPDWSEDDVLNQRKLLKQCFSDLVIAATVNSMRDQSSCRSRGLKIQRNVDTVEHLVSTNFSSKRQFFQQHFGSPQTRGVLNVIY